MLVLVKLSFPRYIHRTPITFCSVWHAAGQVPNNYEDSPGPYSLGQSRYGAQDPPAGPGTPTRRPPPGVGGYGQDSPRNGSTSTGGLNYDDPQRSGFYEPERPQQFEPDRVGGPGYYDPDPRGTPTQNTPRYNQDSPRVYDDGYPGHLSNGDDPYGADPRMYGGNLSGPGDDEPSFQDFAAPLQQQQRESPLMAPPPGGVGDAFHPDAMRRSPSIGSHGRGNATSRAALTTPTRGRHSFLLALIGRSTVLLCFEFELLCASFLSFSICQ